VEELQQKAAAAREVKLRREVVEAGRRQRENMDGRLQLHPAPPSSYTIRIRNSLLIMFFFAVIIAVC
jgi:hypothetical protein